MRRIFAPLTIVIVMLLSSLCAKSQYYYYDNHYYDNDFVWEFGGSVGLMNCIADVGGKKAFMPNIKAAQMNGSIYVGGLYRSFVGARIEATYGRISGADSNGGLHPWRNLSFRTPIREVAVIGELHPLMMKYHDEMPQFSPYIALGIGWFSFNPQANLNGNWIDLQPLRTEGQGFPQKGDGSHPYRLSQSNVILGWGLKYEVSQLITARAEFLYRITYTDYLDDASTNYIDPTWFDLNLSPQAAALAKQLHDRSAAKDQTKTGPGSIRAGSKSNDYYMTFNLKLGINLGRQRRD